MAAARPTPADTASEHSQKQQNTALGKCYTLLLQLVAEKRQENNSRAAMHAVKASNGGQADDI